MGRNCKTCCHPKRAEIDDDILNKVTYRTIGTKYGISHVAIRRHFEHGHISPDKVRATEVKKIAYSEDLLQKVCFYQHEAMKVLIKAEKPDDGSKPLLNVVLNAIAKATYLLKIQGELAGQLKALEVNFSINPTWINLKQQIFTALEPFPDARKAMMGTIENGELSDIQKAMLTPEPGTVPISPEIMAIINSEFEDEKQKESRGRTQRRLQGFDKKTGSQEQLRRQRVRYRCIREHSWHGKMWQVGQVWDSRDFDGPEPPAGSDDWEIFNPSDEVPDRLMPTRR